ncbi:hypothetical protein HNY73_008114 [Argiope bruennichi]|uniref:Uncharacterized protein n=1 Tax=Argiope bruennichi TaxID=94029 RepID=A0A8T0FBT6_ARGBR|nr:hypothetical protein HNY73_008114 [Argiope bruennichi]
MSSRPNVGSYSSGKRIRLNAAYRVRRKIIFWTNSGTLVDPLKLAGKIDQYESIRHNRKPNNFKIPESKSFEKAGHTSPMKEIKNKPDDKSDPLYWKKSTAKGNWRKENFERRTAPACYVCHSTERLRPNCPQLRKNGPNEFVNCVGTTKDALVLFAAYMSKALVNNVEMSILRDSRVTFDLLSSNYVRAEDYTGETVWVKQPLDVNFTCLPLAKVELQSPDFRRIITKAAIIDSSLDNGVYFL